MATAEKLRALGYTHGANGRGYEHSVYRDCAYAFIERRLEEAMERHDPGSGRTSSPTHEALAVYRVVVSLVANEHRANVSLEPR